MDLFKINDRNNLLNLSYTEVYFILTDEENTKYGDLLVGMNHSSSITRGLFHFNVAKKGERMYPGLPSGWYLMNFNVFVRLINSNHGMYCYGIAQIFLEQNPGRMKAQVNDLVDAICMENNDQLYLIKSRMTGSAVEARMQYEAAGFMDIFDQALNRRRIDWINTENGKVRPTDYLEAYYETADRKLSRNLVEGVADASKSAILSKAEAIRTRPERRPEISVTIKMVKSGKCRKDGYEKSAFGFEFVIDGTPVPISFGSIYGTVLYAATLIFMKNGQCLSRRSFMRDCKGKTQEIIMLRRVFEAFSPNRSFEDWYAMAGKKDASLINDALSKLNDKLWKLLSDEFRDAMYYCSLRNKNAGKRDSHYKILIKTENIHIDPSIEARLVGR